MKKTLCLLLFGLTNCVVAVEDLEKNLSGYLGPYISFIDDVHGMADKLPQKGSVEIQNGDPDPRKDFFEVISVQLCRKSSVPGITEKIMERNATGLAMELLSEYGLFILGIESRVQSERIFRSAFLCSDDLPPPVVRSEVLQFVVWRKKLAKKTGWVVESFETFQIRTLIQVQKASGSAINYDSLSPRASTLAFLHGEFGPERTWIEPRADGLPLEWPDKRTYPYAFSARAEFLKRGSTISPQAMLAHYYGGAILEPFRNLRALRPK